MKALSFGNRIAKFGNTCISAGAVNPTYHVNLIESISGTVTADPMKGRLGTIVTLSNTPSAGYALDSYSITGAELTGNTFAIQNSDVSVEGVWGYDAFPITYESDEHVSITGDNLFFPGSTGITLQTGYDTYYRISGYEVTGGTIENGVLIPTGPCTARIVAKVNAFTATGSFEKGSNVTCKTDSSDAKTSNVGAKYATHGAHTGDIPASWYSTSNRWKPNNASAYTMRLMPRMSFAFTARASTTAAATACSLIGSTQSQTASYSKSNATQTSTYSKDFTTTTQNVNYGLSAKLYAKGYYDGWFENRGATATYVANSTTGTWSATGYAP